MPKCPVMVPWVLEHCMYAWKNCIINNFIKSQCLLKFKNKTKKTKKYFFSWRQLTKINLSHLSGCGFCVPEKLGKGSQYSSFILSIIIFLHILRPKFDTSFSTTWSLSTTRWYGPGSSSTDGLPLSLLCCSNEQPVPVYSIHCYQSGP